MIEISFQTHPPTHAHIQTVAHPKQDKRKNESMQKPFIDHSNRSNDPRHRVSQSINPWRYTWQWLAMVVAVRLVPLLLKSEKVPGFCCTPSCGRKSDSEVIMLTMWMAERKSRMVVSGGSEWWIRSRRNKRCCRQHQVVDWVSSGDEGTTRCNRTSATEPVQRKTHMCVCVQTKFVWPSNDLLEGMWAIPNNI